jgi:hypothetical protein
MEAYDYANVGHLPYTFDGRFDWLIGTLSGNEAFEAKVGTCASHLNALAKSRMCRPLSRRRSVLCIAAHKHWFQRTILNTVSPFAFTVHDIVGLSMHGLSLTFGTGTFLLLYGYGFLPLLSGVMMGPLYQLAYFISKQAGTEADAVNYGEIAFGTWYFLVIIVRIV